MEYLLESELDLEDELLLLLEGDLFLSFLLLLRLSERELLRLG